MIAKTNCKVRRAVRVIRPRVSPLCQYLSSFCRCCGVVFMVVDVLLRFVLTKRFDG